jgi:hypothetical protein
VSRRADSLLRTANFTGLKILGYELPIIGRLNPVIRRIVSQGRFCSIAFAFRVSLLYYKRLRF